MHPEGWVLKEGPRQELLLAGQRKDPHNKHRHGPSQQRDGAAGDCYDKIVWESPVILLDGFAEFDFTIVPP